VPRIHLNDTTIRALKADKRTDYWDTKTPAFGVRVGRFTKTFVVKRHNSRIAIGSYPDCSLAKARRRAHNVLGKETERTSSLPYPTVRDLFLETHKLSPRAAHEMKRTLLRYFPWRKKLHQITHNDVAAAIETIEAPSEALHAFKNIRTFFNWCVPRYLKYSPCTGLRPPSTYVPRTRVLTPDEIKRVWNAVDGTFGTIVRLCILTGQRWGEISSLKWEYIGPDIITFPPGVTKNGREHRFPLGDMTRAIIKIVPRLNSTPYLFPGKTGLPWRGSGKCKWQLDKASPLDPWTLHDLRRTFATQLAALGTPIHITERLLNHVSGTQSGIVAIYQRHSYMDEMRGALERYETHLAALLASD
jgi:integrase